MGVQLYRDGKTCNADANQIPAMEAAGWSQEAPKGAEAEQKQEGDQNPNAKPEADAKPEGGDAKSPVSTD